MRWNKEVVGVVTGLLAPLLGVVGYGLVYTGALKPWLSLRFFMEEMFLGTAEYRGPILALALIADAFLFFLFDRWGMQRAMRGVILAMLCYGVVIAIHIL